MKKTYIVGGLMVSLFAVFACKKEKDIPPTPPVADEFAGIAYNPRPYTLVVPESFPQPLPTPNNPLTYEGINLGRHLFYEKRLSKTNGMACANCHSPSRGFSDMHPFSVGVDGRQGTRSSMTLMNLAFDQTEFFWDGRTLGLEKQAGEPVENPIEMHEAWSNVETKLQADTMYHRLFRQAFGIMNRTEITKALAIKAIAQFERTIVVGGNSRYNKVFVRQEGFPTDMEQDGYNLFFQFNVGQPDSEGDPIVDAQCGHCHNAPLFKAAEFFNNGLDDANGDLNNFVDKGRGAVTGNIADNGKFRAPTLYNIALSAPYMHDSRFTTLAQVMDHYSDSASLHFAGNSNQSTFLDRPLHLTPYQKQAVIAFLHTLTDTIAVNKPELKSPF